VAAVREHVWPMVESGLVRPVVHTYLPMPEAPEAHRILDASTHIGKVLLVAPNHETASAE
jgi:NADPH:quinone reductase-like Zn-dependent oxidoreductase